MSSVLLPNPGEELSGTVASLDESAFGQCVNGTAQVITALELPRIFADRVHIRWDTYLQTDGDGKILDKLPCIIVSPDPVLRPDNAGGTNRENAVNFLVNIAIHRASGMDGINQMGACYAALQEIYRAFSKKPNGTLGFEVRSNQACLKDATIDNAESANEMARRSRLLVQFLRVNYSLRLYYGGVA